jgi:pilus assembly protein Flp/PilA
MRFARRRNFNLERVAMQKFLAKFANDESGATAIEYALIAAIVGIGIITSLQSLKTQLSATFNQTATDLAAANAE